MVQYIYTYKPSPNPNPNPKPDPNPNPNPNRLLHHVLAVTLIVFSSYLNFIIFAILVL